MRLSILSYFLIFLRAICSSFSVNCLFCSYLLSTFLLGCWSLYWFISDLHILRKIRSSLESCMQVLTCWLILYLLSRSWPVTLLLNYQLILICPFDLQSQAAPQLFPHQIFLPLAPRQGGWEGAMASSGSRAESGPSLVRKDLLLSSPTWNVWGWAR